MGKNIPLVTVAAPEEAARLAGLPLEATRLDPEPLRELAALKARRVTIRLVPR